ncbi:CPBP family intramembrane glutamic endopeptidase [Virgibacillus alimentarius]|uniref:Membrane protease YdiL (CAAX protease family) n=1 Tax=Virgibacillus alimentarius TaxID=698769 RepID=A0ABS4SC00_9BACI|nr:type II CAAX endopeptidase family protein [Virgibacillus alimentarius]MBP2259043.1 membrane protease YdiL (CAAX protease family) [Virgibacillus alimentarius]
MTKRYWWVIITYIIMQFSGVLFAPILYTALPISKFQAVISWSIISFIIGLIVVLVLMKPDMKMERNINAASPGQMILWSFVGLFMAYVAQGLAITIETNLFGIKPGSANTEAIVNIARSAPLFIIIPALIAPILEEIIFRKIIFGVLYTRTNFFIAAVLSALVFGIIHGEPMHILIYASMGFVFAFLYVKTKRIIVPIIVHMALNTISVIVQLSFDPEDLERIQNQLEQAQMIFIGG